MFRDLPGYEALRPTGLPWAVGVPKHWAVGRAKTVMTALDRRSWSGEEELLTVSSRRGVVPRATASVTMFQADSYVGQKLCWPDDLVINSLWAWGRGLGVARHHGIVSSAYGVYRLHRGGRLLPDYLHQLVRSEPFQWELQVRSQGVWKSRLQMTDARWLDAPLLLPPPDEQAAIVKYLAHADARIDKAITAKRRLIALLEEQRQAQVARAFSSAFEGHRSEVPLKHLVQVKGGMTPDRENALYWGGSIPWVSPKDVKTDVLVGSIDRITPVALEETSCTLVSHGSVVIVVRGMILARTVPVALLGVDAALNQDMKALVPRERRLDAVYLRDWLRANEGEIAKLMETAGHGTKTLRTDLLMNVRIPVPSLPVQAALSDAAARETAIAERAVRRIQDEVSLLQEFRTRLVADVVTGQVDVRAVAATLPDAPEAIADFAADLGEQLEEEVAATAEADVGELDYPNQRESVTI